MDEVRSRGKRRSFYWPGEATELAKAYLKARQRNAIQGKNSVPALVTRLVELSGNPRDACIRFLYRQGITEKRTWRSWTKPEQQRLFDLIETCPIEEISRVIKRSHASIRSMLHRLGESSQRGREWFTAYSLAEALHIRVDEVRKWVQSGWLKCRTLETTGVKKQIIDPDDFSDFVKHYGPAVVGRRLGREGLWFVQNFVFPPKHAHLLPLRKSKDSPTRNGEDEDDQGKAAEENA